VCDHRLRIEPDLVSVGSSSSQADPPIGYGSVQFRPHGRLTAYAGVCLRRVGMLLYLMVILLFVYNKR